MNDPVHMDFVVAAANLRAANYGLKGETDLDVFRKVLPSVMVPEFQVKQLKIAENDEELKRQQEESNLMVDADSQADALISKLPSPQQLAGYRMHPAEFEKDEDTNFHMDFVTAASNLRARCYSIPRQISTRRSLLQGRLSRQLPRPLHSLLAWYALSCTSLSTEREMLRVTSVASLILPCPSLLFQSL